MKFSATASFFFFLLCTLENKENRLLLIAVKTLQSCATIFTSGFKKVYEPLQINVVREADLNTLS